MRPDLSIHKGDFILLPQNVLQDLVISICGAEQSHSQRTISTESRG
jgi:hypothetical protein